jgi:hypothetical protein
LVNQRLLGEAIATMPRNLIRGHFRTTSRYFKKMGARYCAGGWMHRLVRRHKICTRTTCPKVVTCVAQAYGLTETQVKEIISSNDGVLSDYRYQRVIVHLRGLLEEAQNQPHAEYDIVAESEKLIQEAEDLVVIA